MFGGNIFEMLFNIVGKGACCCIFLILMTVAATVTLHEPIMQIAEKVEEIIRQAAAAIPEPQERWGK